MVEFWQAGGSYTTVQTVLEAEAEGWDGQMLMDSQCLSRDCYVRMGAAAMATKRIKLSPGVTNPLTRHPAVIAGSMATVQELSSGRAVLGIGRGDSSLAYLGYAPARVAEFRRALISLQALLSGRAIPFQNFLAESAAPRLDSLSLGDRPQETRLQWLPADQPKVPLDVAATGPAVIEIAAQLAERVTFSVGAMPERIDWAIGLARKARLAAGLPASGVSYGAQIIVLCEPDRSQALEHAARMVAPLARFQVMQGKVAGPVSEMEARNFAAIATGYDMTKHSAAHDVHPIVGGKLEPEFVERFAIVGDPDRCVARIVELLDRGLDRLVIAGPGRVSGSDASLLVRDVLPAVRAAWRDRADPPRRIA